MALKLNSLVFALTAFRTHALQSSKVLRSCIRGSPDLPAAQARGSWTGILHELTCTGLLLSSQVVKGTIPDFRCQWCAMLSYSKVAGGKTSSTPASGWLLLDG